MGGGLPAGGPSRVPPGKLRLHRVELVPADDALVVIPYQVHRQVPSVADMLLADAILGIGLLHQHIAAVLLIFQDVPYAPVGPGRPALGGRDARLLQLRLYHTDAVPGKEAVEYLPDYRRLLGDDLRPAVLAPLVGIEMLVLDDRPALPHGLPLAPGDIGGHALALRLGEGPHHGDEQLAVHLQRVDVLLLEPCVDEKDTVQKQQNKVK